MEAVVWKVAGSVVGGLITISVVAIARNMTSVNTALASIRTELRLMSKGLDEVKKEVHEGRRETARLTDRVSAAEAKLPQN